MTALLKVQNVPEINIERCSGCGRCVAACPQGIITLETTGFRKHAAVMKPNQCTACGHCVAACPINAISSR